MSTEVDLEIVEGKSFKHRIYWRGTKHIYAKIKSITKDGPVRVETVDAHGMPANWEAAVIAAGGLTELNAKKNPPDKSEYHPALVVSPTIIEFNAIAGAAFGNYTSGGYIQFFEPMPMAGVRPRWVVKDKVDGTAFFDITDIGGGIIVNEAEHYFELHLTAEETKNVLWRRGRHELSVTNPSIPFTYKVIHGKVVTVQDLSS